MWEVPTLLKNKTENNSTWKGAFYQSECVIINSIRVILDFFFFMCVASNAYEFFFMDHLTNIGHFLYHSKLSF